MLGSQLDKHKQVSMDMAFGMITSWRLKKIKDLTDIRGFPAYVRYSKMIFDSKIAMPLRA